MSEPKKRPPNAIAEFSLRDANPLKKLFEAISRITTEPTFKIEWDMLCIRQMNPSRTSMIDYTIKKEFFEEWHVTSPGACCFSMEEVLKVAFGKLKKDTAVTVRTNETHITFIMREGRIRERTFPLLEASEEALDTLVVPKLTYDATIKVEAKKWMEDIEDLTKVSDHITMTATADLLTVKAESDCAKGENKYTKGSDVIVDFDVFKESQAAYSLSCLTDEIKIDPTFCDIAVLEFSTDRPIRITMRTLFGDLYSFLAPRIETD